MVRKDDSATLRCEAYGDKPLTISWSKDKAKIDSFGEVNTVFGSSSSYSGKTSIYEISETSIPNGLLSIINIKKVDRSDSSRFTCAASNAYGYEETNIQLIVTEAPDPPQDLQIVEISSRGIKLAWSPPYSGNSPITTYYVLYSPAFSDSKVENISISSEDETFVEIRNLHPAQTYSFKLIAENLIGKSEPGKSLEVTTEEEAPEGPPLKVQILTVTSKSVKIAWKAPLKHQRNGVLKGYYIGYKQVSTSSKQDNKKDNSEDTFIYKTLQITDDFKEEVTIRGLKRFTKYVIVIQAFNNKGAYLWFLSSLFMCSKIIQQNILLFK